jgi:hypothetical protein
MNINSGQPWSEGDLWDLRDSLAHGCTAEEVADFLCRDLMKLSKRWRNSALRRAPAKKGPKTSGGTMSEPPPPLTWRNVSTRSLQDFIGYEGERGVARIYKAEQQKDWRWSVYGICPAVPGVTNGHEGDPKEARRKVETAWQMAKERGWRDPQGRLIE